MSAPRFVLACFLKSLTAFVLACGLVSAMPFTSNAATSVDFFVYEGTQSGLPPGTVISVSTGTNQLALCVNRPSGDEPEVTYTPDCDIAAAPGSGLSSGNAYTAVAFMGSYKDAGNVSRSLFAVGDRLGNVYLMYPVVNNEGAPQYLNQVQQLKYDCASQTWSTNGSLPCGHVTSLAKDPSSEFLYVSFANYDPKGEVALKSSGYVTAFSGRHYAPQATLMAIKVNLDGTLPRSPQNKYYNFIWQDYGSSYGINGDGTFKYISPKLRVYSPDYPGIANTNYAASGAVFYSGIIGNSDGDYPVNKGYLCSNGSCQVSFNVTLIGTGFSVMTAAEYGIDIHTGKEVPVLYWNQVAGDWYPVKDPISGGTYRVPEIPKGTSNTVRSCQLKSPVSSAVTNSPCSSLSSLSWPPAGGVNAGPFVNELVYLPASDGGSGNPSDIGVLMMSVWSPGYLAYHAVTGNGGTAILFGSGSAGEFGANPYSLVPDDNGSLFVEAGAEGLVGFNIFTLGNLGAPLDPYTYITITSGSSEGSYCGTVCKVENGLKIVYKVVSVVSTLTTGLSPAMTDTSVDRKKPRQSSSFGIPAPSITGPLAVEAHQGMFTYSEAEVRNAGIKLGQRISGMRFALAEGLGPRPYRDVTLDDFRVQMISSGKAGKRPSSAYPFTVFDGTLCVESKSYDRTKDGGFGPVIWFDRPYRYLGGDLTIEVQQASREDDSYPFYLEAVKNDQVKGAYAKTMEPLPDDFPSVNRAPRVKFETRLHPKRGKSSSCS